LYTVRCINLPYRKANVSPPHLNSVSIHYFVKFKVAFFCENRTAGNYSVAKFNIFIILVGGC